MGIGIINAFESNIETPIYSGNLARHMYFSGGYVLKTGDYLSIEPSIIASYVKPAPLETQVSTKVRYRFNGDESKSFYLGLGYRTGDFGIVSIGGNFNSISFAYSLELLANDSPLKKYFSIPHEITIGFNMRNLFSEDCDEKGAIRPIN